jgi:hypothetical protein
MTTRRGGRPRGSKLTDRLSVRVTAAQKLKIEQFCLDADLLQKEFILMAIDRMMTAA